jgi:protease-4
MASDRIHREVQRLAERKPVVAALGNVAASGGYYVAAGAHAIVAQPTTITGSIGVVSARVLARGLLDRMGVRTETLRTAPHADMFSVARVLDDDERSLVERELEAVYWGFVDVVAQGRGQSREQIDAIARGRVWAGADALEQGLVDRLGGFEIAVEEARRRVPERRARGEPLRPKAITPRKLDLPPPEPEGSKRSPWMQALPEEAWELLGLVSGPERLLCYAPLLPRVR